MDHSPRKRITRSGAAAKAAGKTPKANESETSTSKSGIVLKRKTGTDENQGSSKRSAQETLPMESKMTRTRLKKFQDTETEAPIETGAQAVESISSRKPTRGRPRKVPIEPNVSQPTRMLRGKSTKSIVNENKKNLVQDKPPTRSRGQINNVSTNIEIKRTIKFDEPDKENILPITKQKKNPTKEEVHTGLRAKPMRKPGSARATRSLKSGVEEAEKKSTTIKSKKNLGIDVLKEFSDDELALNSKKMSEVAMCSPEKFAGNTLSTNENHEVSSNITTNPSISNQGQDLKSSILSPARRPPASPFKDGMKMSPQKINSKNALDQSIPITSIQALKTKDMINKTKTPLLLSPAKRPHSSARNLDEDSPLRLAKKETILITSPKPDVLRISRFTTPKTDSLTVGDIGEISYHKRDMVILANSNQMNINVADCSNAGPELKFTGRLSSITPRDIDSVSVSESLPHEILGSSGSLNNEIETMTEVHHELDLAVMAENNDDMNLKWSNTIPTFPQQTSFEPFAYRMEGINYQDSDSEDELAFNPLQTNRAIFHSDMELPCTTPKKNDLFINQANQSIGFTPLAQQLSHWMASSPKKFNMKSSLAEIKESEPENSDIHVEFLASSIPNTSSNNDDDEMMKYKLTISPPNSAPSKIDLVDEFEPVEFDPQDLELALEANEMSLLDSSQIDIPDNDLFSYDLTHQEQLDKSPSVPQTEDGVDPQRVSLIETHNATISEVNQEDLEDSDIIIDPRLLELPIQYSDDSCTTPKRIISRTTYHTICKVPLKPIADDTPARPLQRKSVSSYRLPVTRPSVFLNEDLAPFHLAQDTSNEQNDTPLNLAAHKLTVSPSKQVSNWMTVGTPVRTPRPNLNRSLLEGAVVFVDVYTTEGADASFIFTEVLTQMGARCIKSWNWNGIDDAKIGISHVVFKDGGKRTLEKVRESNGHVTCIGVGWVLDCERENKWLDETPYLVDTTVIPRGGARRRKSMEPKSLANLNETLIPWAEKTRHSCHSGDLSRYMHQDEETPMTSRSHRRDSVQWIHPSATFNANIQEIENFISPLPSTPRPEDFAAYEVDEISDETLTESEPYFLHKEQLVQKTAPPAKRYIDIKDGIEDNLSAGSKHEDSDEVKNKNLMIRLMAARRKSLQWAPKVGSPLAKAF